MSRGDINHQGGRMLGEELEDVRKVRGNGMDLVLQTVGENQC